MSFATENYIDWWSADAEAYRLRRLVQRLADEGFRNGEAVPARIAQMVNEYRSNRLRFVPVHELETRRVRDWRKPLNCLAVTSGN
jgi:hypothetical protein